MFWAHYISAADLNGVPVISVPDKGVHVGAPDPGPLGTRDPTAAKDPAGAPGSGGDQTGPRRGVEPRGRPTSLALCRASGAGPRRGRGRRAREAPARRLVGPSA